MNFNKWIDTFIEEKNIDIDTPIDVEGPGGTNYMTVGTVIEVIKSAPNKEQKAIQNKLVQLDLENQDVLPFFKYLAEAIAV